MKTYLNQQDMKDANLNNIFHLLLREKSMTRRQIEAATGLSWGAVSNVTALLLKNGFVKEVKAPNPGNGRTPAYLEINDAAHFIIGVDVNTSGFKSSLLNLKNETVYTVGCRPAIENKKEMLQCITNLIHEVLDYADGCSILCIGIAMQGLVDSDNGISVQFSPCKDWKNVPLATILEDALGIPVFLEHDPNCVLYACSSPRQISEAILVRIDNGIGMSVLMDGKIFKRPGAFEIGHMTAVPNGRKCSCGNSGCLEAYASMSGMELIFGMSFEVLAELARQKSPDALSVFDEMIRYLAPAISGAAALLNINEIILCGDMLLYQDLFFDQLILQANAYHKVPLHFSTTEIDNAAVGAAIIAIERYTLTTEQGE